MLTLLRDFPEAAGALAVAVSGVFLWLAGGVR